MFTPAPTVGLAAMRDMLQFFFWLGSIFGVLMAAASIGCGEFKMAICLLLGSLAMAVISEWVRE